MIPADLQPIVDRALRAAFATTTLDDITPLTGGMRNALTCRIVVAGHPYVLRIGATSHVDPAVELATTRIAADAGLAPKTRHADPADRVLITDFITQAPRPTDYGLLIARTCARIHALPPWPKRLHHLDILDLFLGRLRDAGLRPDAADVLARYAQLAAIYPRDADLVACHNDVKPQNLLYDGDRIWVIDWEAAFVNDRYADLAIVANFFVAPAEEDAYLAAYFGAPPTAYQRARFVLARFANHLSYAAFLSLTAARAGVTDQPTPDDHTFHAGLIDGTIDLSGADRKLQYANVHLAAARAMTLDPALAIVRDAR